jgi:hypothetical protein
MKNPKLAYHVRIQGWQLAVNLISEARKELSDHCSHCESCKKDANEIAGFGIAPKWEGKSLDAN